jgi:N-acyl-D-amino-acid deacylase
MHFDLIIRNGLVVDGTRTGTARVRDIGVRDGRIVAIGDLSAATAAEDVDASMKVVAPGFIDVHIHSENSIVDPTNHLRHGSMLQGVTTHLTAPDGFGWAQLPRDKELDMWEYLRFGHEGPAPTEVYPTAASYLATFPGNTAVNVVPQIPHLSVRFAVMGWDDRPATDDEIRAMERLTLEWLDEGAVCLNLGLDYVPTASADMREIVALSKLAHAHGAIYAAHARYSGLGRVDAWRETFEIGRQSGIPVHLSHENVNDESEPLFDEAAKVCDLSFESYIYPAGCTHLALMLPLWAQAGGTEAVRRNLHDPAKRALMRDHMEQVLTDGGGRGYPVFVANQTGRWLGRDLRDVAAELGMSRGDFAMQVLEEEHPFALMVYHRGYGPVEEADVIRRTIRHPQMMVASDGMYHGDYGHPRGFGCFARILRLAVRDMQAISLEEAVWKMAGYPAERFRIGDRGFIKEGLAADLVIFDMQTVADRATWTDARLEPVGIDRVVVNGVTTVLDGQVTGAMPGQVVRRKA